MIVIMYYNGFNYCVISTSNISTLNVNLFLYLNKIK